MAKRPPSLAAYQATKNRPLEPAPTAESAPAGEGEEERVATTLRPPRALHEQMLDLATHLSRTTRRRVHVNDLYVEGAIAILSKHSWPPKP